MTTTLKREFDYLEKAGFVLLVLQFAIFGKMWNDLGLDRALDSLWLFVAVTAAFIAGQRKLVAKPLQRGAGRWILASRAAMLAMLALGTLVIGFYRLVPAAAPAPALVPQALFALLWAVIALKGAGVGKLKPGGPLGLRVPWTLQSRLAWDRAHRVLGRVLFWGGLIGLATIPAVPPFASIAMWFGTVGLAVVVALLEGWRTWRLDPGRARPA